ALVAIMIMVSVGTFRWSSFKGVATQPRRSSVVMLATVLTVIGTHNLALGVGVGVLLSGIFFAWKVAQFLEVDTRLEGRVRTYVVYGQVFFALAETFLAAFEFRQDI